MTYTETHLAAFRAYQAKGYRLDGLTEPQLEALREDPNFHTEIATWRRKAVSAAETKAATDPLSLTERDLATLEAISPAREHAAREAQREKQLAIVRQHQAVPPTETGVDTWDAYVATHGHETMTLATTDAFVTVVTDVWKKHWAAMNETPSATGDSTRWKIASWNLKRRWRRATRDAMWTADDLRLRPMRTRRSGEAPALLVALRAAGVTASRTTGNSIAARPCARWTGTTRKRRSTSCTTSSWRSCTTSGRRCTRGEDDQSRAHGRPAG